MTCDRALEAMLVADRAELEPALDRPGPRFGPAAAAPASDLSGHLARCERCAAVARTLVRELAELEAGLATFGSAVSPDAAANAALTAARGLRVERSAVSRSPPPAQGRRSGGAGRWMRLASVPVTAAAAVAVLLLVPRPDSPPPGVGRDSVPAVERLAGTGGIVGDRALAVTPPAGRSAAVMNTANPDITIIWLYRPETQERRQ